MILLLVACIGDRPDTSGLPPVYLDTDEELDSDTDTAVETDTWDSASTETGDWDTAWTDTTAECPEDTENEWWVCNAVATYRGTRNIYGPSIYDWDPLYPIVGDFDGDGRLGLGVSAPYSYRGTGLYDGLVYVENDIEPGVHRLSDGDDLVYASGSNEYLRLVDAVDATGDGVDDGVFQEWVSDDADSIVYLVPGPFVGFRSVTQAVMTVSGGYEGYLRAADASGDLDGDGVPELLLITARFQAAEGDVDAVVAFPGDATGGFVDEDAAWWVESPSGYAGASLIDDVTGDGMDDLVQGMPYGEDRRGQVFVFEGPIREPLRVEDAVGVRTGAGERDTTGDQVAVCDFNEDGVPDLVTDGSGYASPYGSLAGVVSITYGPLTGEESLEDSEVRITGTYEWAFMRSVAAHPSPRGAGCMLVTNADAPYRDWGPINPESLMYVWFAPPEGTWFSNAADVRVRGSFNLAGDGLLDVPVEDADALRLLVDTFGNDGPDTIAVLDVE